MEKAGRLQDRERAPGYGRYGRPHPGTAGTAGRQAPRVTPCPCISLSHTPHPHLIRSQIRQTNELLGKLRALGKKIGTIVHKLFPEAENFPSVPGARRTMRRRGITGRTRIMAQAVSASGSGGFPEAALSPCDLAPRVTSLSTLEQAPQSVRNHDFDFASASRGAGASYRHDRSKRSGRHGAGGAGA